MKFENQSRQLTPIKLRVRRGFQQILYLGLVCAVAACGGGVGGTGGGSDGGGGGGGGVGGTGVVALGAVKTAEPTAVTVNNTTYQITAQTKVTIDAQTALVTDLQPGMVVEVDAFKRTATQVTEAEFITYKNSLTGPIASINPNCASMVVLGQTIEADTHTLPKLANGLCDFQVGQVVEISGYVSDVATNVIRATFIRLKSASVSINVSGNITSVVTAQKTFSIGSLTIDYAGAVFEPSGAVPEINRFARVSGVQTTADTIAATQVKIENHDIGGQPGDEAEVEGFVSELTGFNFKVNGRAIDADQAEISPITAVLENGVKVEVHGKINAQSVIVATEVEIKPAAHFLAALQPGGLVKAEDIHGQGKSLDAKNGTVEIID